MPEAENNPKSIRRLKAKAASGSIRHIFGIEPILSFQKKLANRLKKIKKEDSAIIEKKSADKDLASIYGGQFFRSCHSRAGGNPGFGAPKPSWRKNSAKALVIFSRPILSLGSFVRRLLKQKTQNTRLGYDLEQFSFNTQKKIQAARETSSSLKSDLVYFFRVAKEIISSLIKLATSLIRVIPHCVIPAKAGIYFRKLFRNSHAQEKKTSKN